MSPMKACDVQPDMSGSREDASKKVPRAFVRCRENRSDIQRAGMDEKEQAHAFGMASPPPPTRNNQFPIGALVCSNHTYDTCFITASNSNLRGLISLPLLTQRAGNAVHRDFAAF